MCIWVLLWLPLPLQVFEHHFVVGILGRAAERLSVTNLPCCSFSPSGGGWSLVRYQLLWIPPFLSHVSPFLPNQDKIPACQPYSVVISAVSTLVGCKSRVDHLKWLVSMGVPGSTHLSVFQKSCTTSNTYPIKLAWNLWAFYNLYFLLIFPLGVTPCFILRESTKLNKLTPCPRHALDLNKFICKPNRYIPTLGHFYRFRVFNICGFFISSQWGGERFRLSVGRISWLCGRHRNIKP